MIGAGKRIQAAAGNRARGNRMGGGFSSGLYFTVVEGFIVR
jgi:hypothetical protein